MNEKMQVGPLPNKSVLVTYSERDLIQLDPEYQRMGEIWNLEKRQLFIDSIINGFDIPKIYLHDFQTIKNLGNKKKVQYAVIDGRQRLETIWAFINNEFTLSNDFVYYENSDIKMAGMTYDDISKKHPIIKIRFDGYTLPVVAVVTENIDMIEEMFARLNEAVTLSAAEKRNALGGPLLGIIRDITKAHKFFTKNVPFPNKRYQHHEVCAKFLLLLENEKIVDIKKAYLDAMIKRYKKQNMLVKADELKTQLIKILNKMTAIFTAKDKLLKTQAMTVTYLLIFKSALDEEWLGKVTRDRLVEFENRRKENRKIAEQDIMKAQYELLEFDKMSLQGTNDAPSIKYREDVLKKFLKSKK